MTLCAAVNDRELGRARVTDGSVKLYGPILSAPTAGNPALLELNLAFTRAALSRPQETAPAASNIQAAVALSIVNRVPNRPSYLSSGHLCTHASRALACTRVTRPFLCSSAPLGPKAEPVSAFARVLDTDTGTRNRSWSQPSARTRRRCRCGRLAERRVPAGAVRDRTHLAGPSERTESSPCFHGSRQLFITRIGPGNLGQLSVRRIFHSISILYGAFARARKELLTAPTGGFRPRRWWRAPNCSAVLMREAAVGVTYEGGALSFRTAISWSDRKTTNISAPPLRRYRISCRT
jgi:hypothetical protein